MNEKEHQRAADVEEPVQSFLNAFQAVSSVILTM